MPAPRCTGVDSDDPLDERIASILSEDPLTRVRARYYPTVSELGPATKLRVLGGVGAVAAVVPAAVVAVRGEAVGATLGVAEPLAASVAASVVLAAGLKFLTIGSLLVGFSEAVKGGGEMTENRALRVVGLEDVGLFVGVAPGGALTGLGLAALGWFALGGAAPADVGGVVSLEALVAPVPMPTTYGVLVVWAALIAVGSLAGSVAADEE